MAGWPVGMIVPMQDPTPFSCFRPAEWQQALRSVANAGFDGVELAITNPVLLDVAEVAEALEVRGLRLLSITTGQAAGLEGLSLSSDDAEIRRRAIQRICDHMGLARALGGVVIVGSLRGADGSLEILRDALAECAAFDPEVPLALEPLNRYESRLLNSIDTTLGFLETIGAPNLGILFDTFHANIEEADIASAIAAAGERLLHVHLADSNRWVPGNGHFDFSPVWSELDRIRYSRACVLEPMPKPSAEALLDNVQWLRQAWGT